MTRFAVQNVSTAILPGRIAQAKHSTRLSGPQLPHQGIPQVQPRTRGDFCQAGSFLSTAVKEGPAAASPEAAIRAVVLYAMAWVTLQYVARMNRRRLSLTERTVPRQRRESVQKVLAALFSRTSLIALSLEAIIWPTEILLGLTALVKLASMGYAWLDATTFAAQPAVRSALHVVSLLSDRLTGVAIVACLTWGFLRLKARIMEFIVEKDDDDPLERILLPVSGLLTWVAVGLALIACLRLTGLDVTPLLTVGGISGVVLGFAAQGPLANLLAGLQLYISQPFVVGDKVEIKSAFGATIASGWVERIEPTRTYITNDKFVPLSLPNKLVTDLLVSVVSRPNTSALASKRFNRQISTDIALRLEDVGKIPAIVSAINSWLHKHPGIENSLPQYAFWSDSSSAAHTISVMCYTSKARGNMPAEHALRQEFLGHIDKVLSDHGAARAPPA